MNVLIYEDDDNLRQSLTLLIGGTSVFQVVGAHPNCQNVAEQVNASKPDIVLMDIDMPEVDGIQGVEIIKSEHPDIKILMHTVFDDNDRLFACLKAGADGYLLKKTRPIELLEALQDIHNGGAPMSPGIARMVLHTFRSVRNYGLTPREMEVLQALTDGFTYKSIADKLDISKETVTTHLKKIYQKLHVNCATEAVAKAIRERLVP